MTIYLCILVTIIIISLVLSFIIALGVLSFQALSGFPEVVLHTEFVL